MAFSCSASKKYKFIQELTVKKINISWIIAVIWILAACLFFSMGKIWVGIIWFALGIINVIRAVYIAQMNKKVRLYIEC